MNGVIDTLRIQYVVDVADKGTKPLLASERAVQKSVVQTSRALSQQDAALRRSAATTTATASARAKSTRSTAAATAQVTRLARAERAAATESARTAAATNKVAAANERLAVSARRAEAAQAKATRRRPGVVTSTGNAASSARSNVGIAAGVAGAIGISQTIKFDRALRNVNSIAGLTEKQLQKVGQRLRDMASDTAQGPETLALGLYDLVSSGFDAEESMGILHKAALAATAGLTTTEISAAAVAAVLNAYKLPASEAGKVSDQLFQTVNRGVVSFEQLASNIGTVLPVAASLGVGLDQVGAALATMTKQGIGPEEAVVRLQGAMTKFIKPSEDMEKALKKIGAESGEQLIRQKGLQGAIEAVAGATDGSKAAFAKLFPDVRAMQGALALTGKNAKGAKGDLDGLARSGGATQKALAEQSKSTSYQWNQAKANAQALGITVGNGLLPKLNGALKTFTALPGPVKIAMAAIGGAALVVGPINKLRKNVVELGGSIVSVGRRAADSRIAARLASGASGAGGRIRRALSGVKGVIEKLMSGAGRRGGAVAAESIASSAGSNMGPALDRHARRFRGGRWGTLGRAAGRSFGVAAAAYAIWSFKDEINKAPDTDWGKIFFAPFRAGKSLAEKLQGKRRGGVVRRYQSGGLVPIFASGGEMHVDGGRASMIPGPSDRDGTPMLVRPGSAIVTADGQARMAMGASLAEAVRAQAPHFAKGGVVPGKYVATSYGPPWGGIQGTGVTRTGVNLKGNPRIYGIATDPGLIPLGSKVFAHPNPFGYTGRFSAFDTGGAIKGRRIDFYDWRGRKRQNAWGRRAVTISRARIAPRGDGEDTYRAPGGGGSEATIRVLGRSRRRTGLLEDAFGQGQAAGREGLTRGRIRAEGNPVLKAIAEAIAGAGTQPDKGGRARKAGATELSESGGFTSGSRLARMHAKAAAIDAKRYQYSWGGGHGKIGVPTVGSRTPRGGKRGLGYDCSGAVSAVLGAGGLLKSPMTSGSLMGWGRKGSSRNLAVYSDPGHVIMRIGRRYFGTGEANPDGGAGWLPNNTMKGRGVTRTSGLGSDRAPGRKTPTGGGGGADGRRVGYNRRGGIIRGYRAGGIILGGVITTAAAGRSAARGAGPALTRGLSRAMSIAGGSLEALDTIIGGAVEQRLLALRDTVTKRVRRGGPSAVIERLQGVLDMIDFELGRRVGRIQDLVERRAAQVERRRGITDRTLRAGGVEGDSAQGIGVMATLQAQETRVRQRNVASLQSALRRARNARNPAAVKEITQQLTDAQDELHESMTRQVELWRDRIRAAAQEHVGAAQFRLGLSQTGAAGLEAAQRLNRTQDTPEGMAQRAGYQQGVIVPALAAAAAAAQQQAAMLASIGDVNGWRQAVQDAASAAVDLANAQADAADLMREAAARAAQDRVDAATSGRTLSDLALQRLELEQRLIGTFDSTGAAQGRADFIRQQILPAIQAELAALEAQRVAAQQAGDLVLARQIGEAVAGKQNEVLQAQLDAQQQTAENTAALKEFGGSSAFSLRDQIYTDDSVDIIRARVGA